MKQAIPWLLAILAWAWQPALAEEGVPFVHDLHKDSQLARDKEGVVLVIFTRPNCPYCRTVLNEFILPLSRNADYQARLVMRRVDSSAVAGLRDFAGQAISQHKFAAANGVGLVPTVMLFDAEGHQLSNPLVGISSVDYYGFFLYQAIDQALAKVRGGGAVPAAPVGAVSDP